MYSQKSLKKKAGKVRLLGDMKTEARWRCREGATGQGMKMASRRGKIKETTVPLEAEEVNMVLPTPWSQDF